MTARWKIIVFALLAPLVLMGCVLTPGKFASTLSIDADRSFAFTYKGEVYAIDVGDELASGMDKALEDESDDASPPGEASGDDAEKKAKAERRNQAIAEALRKEAGYRSVDYKGDGLFIIDYAISGTLGHGFVYPFNTDAEIMFPFLTIELRGTDMVRVKAPAFGDNDAASGTPGASEMANHLDGTFTLSTDATIVSQNSEDGAREEGGRKIVSWHATSLSKDAPMAMLRVAPRD